MGIVNDAVTVAEVDGKSLVFAPVRVGTYGYGVICVSDFSQSQANISALKGNVIAILIVCGVFVGAAFIGYAYTLVNRERVNLFNYKFTLSKTGRVIKTNKAFKDDFAAIIDVVPPEKLDKKKFTLVALSSDNGGEVYSR